MSDIFLEEYAAFFIVQIATLIVVYIILRLRFKLKAITTLCLSILTVAGLTLLLLPLNRRFIIRMNPTDLKEYVTGTFIVAIPFILILIIQFLIPWLKELGSELKATGPERARILRMIEEGKVTSRTRRLNFWPRAFSPTTYDRKLALLHYGIEIISLDDNLQKIEEFPPYQWKHGVIHCAVFSPKNDAIIAGTFKGDVYIIPLPFDLANYKILTQHPQRIQGIEILKKHNSIITADASGIVQMMGWANRKMLGKIRTVGNQLTSLNISPDGSYMALGDSDASLSLWDLRCLDIPDMLKNPLSDSSPNHLAALRSTIDNKSINQRIRNALVYLERILRHRFRFDVEISSVTEIKSGEYDIEIE